MREHDAKIEGTKHKQNKRRDVLVNREGERTGMERGTGGGSRKREMNWNTAMNEVMERTAKR